MCVPLPFGGCHGVHTGRGKKYGALLVRCLCSSEIGLGRFLFVEMFIIVVPLGNRNTTEEVHSLCGITFVTQVLCDSALIGVQPVF